MDPTYQESQITDIRDARKEEDILDDVNEWSYLVYGLADDSRYINDCECIIAWEHVQRVVVDSDVIEIDRCPICLETPPTAPRLAKCGHIFCLMCILKYMTQVSVQCPLCMDRLYLVKPLIYRGPEPFSLLNIGDTLDLELVCRSKHGLHVVNSDGAADYSSRAIWGDNQSRYSPLFHTSKNDLLDMYMQEQKAIKELKDCMDAGDKPEYCDRALEEIKVEMTLLKDKLPSKSIKVFNDEEEEYNDDNNKLYYYFYQPKSRPRTFLVNEDVKFLLGKYKHFTKFPHNLTVKIQDIQIVKLDSKLKGRFRYLDHLPLGTIVRFIRCLSSYNQSCEQR